MNKAKSASIFQSTNVVVYLRDTVKCIIGIYEEYISSTKNIYN